MAPKDEDYAFFLKHWTFGIVSYLERETINLSCISTVITTLRNKFKLLIMYQTILYQLKHYYELLVIKNI